MKWQEEPAVLNTFDPYHIWLGILPKEQPPHHYRLLGLALFESDSDVISNAADQRMAHLKTFQAGSQSNLSQRLLNEISAAKICLLTPNKKAAYDAHLLETMKPQEPASRSAEPPPVMHLHQAMQPEEPSSATFLDELVNEAKPARTKPKVKQRNAYLWFYVSFAGAAVIVLLIGIAVFLLSQTKDCPTEATSPQIATLKSRAPTVDFSSIAAPPPIPKHTPTIPRRPVALDAIPSQPSETTVTPPTQPATPYSAGPGLESSDEAQDAVKTNPVPDNVAQAKATQLVKEVYGDEYSKAKTSAEKQALAKRLLEKGTETEDNPANRFVLLRLARDIATQAGDGLTAFATIDAMAETFQIDVLAMKAGVLTKFASIAQNPAQHKSVSEEALKLVNQAISQDNFAVANELGKLAQAEAQNAPDEKLVTQAQGRITEINELVKTHESVKTARVTLEKTPDDPEANLVVGKYLCFVKDDWDKGLPMLALGKDGGLKALARQELQGGVSSTEKTKLGDSWWDLAEKQEGAAKKQMQARAGHWYRQALPGLSGLMKDRVMKRIVFSQKQSPMEDPAVFSIDQTTERKPGDGKKSSDEKKSLELKKREHTSWNVKTVKYYTVREPIMENRIRHVGGGVAQTYQVFSGDYRDVQKKRYVYEPIQGLLVSYQGSDVTIDVSGQGQQTFRYGALSTADCKFLQEYRKLKQE